MIENQSLAGSRSGRSLETGHVLAIELIGLARFTRDELPGVVTEFQRLVMSTPQVREALDRNSILIQTREHSIQLVFLGDPLAALKCALQAANEAKRRPNVRLRMGLHSGPVYVPSDLTDARECSGEALSGAQLLMTVGREGHILISEPVARAASTVELWSRYINDLGECEVRPGNRIRLFSLFGGSIGNPTHPLDRAAASAVVKGQWRRRRRISLGSVVFVLFLIVIAGTAAAWFVSPGFKTWAEEKYRSAFPAAATKVAKKKPARKSAKQSRVSRTRNQRIRASMVGATPSYTTDPQTRSENRSRPPVESSIAESEEADSEGSHFTALILHARGLTVNKGEGIRILAADGSELWSGAPQFAASLGAARGMEVSGENPLVLKAVRTGSAGSELTVGSSAAERLRAATSENPFLEGGCVIVVN